MKEAFKAIKEWNGIKRDKRTILNTNILNSSGLPFQINSRGFYMLRSKEYPRVDFYPSTGRWIWVNHGKALSGGAVKFLVWLNKNHLDNTTI